MDSSCRQAETTYDWSHLINSQHVYDHTGTNACYKMFNFTKKNIQFFSQRHLVVEGIFQTGS